MSTFYKGINTSSINSALILTIGDSSAGVNISSTNLTGTNMYLVNSNLVNASITNTYLVNSHLVNASATNFSSVNASLTNTYLVNSNLVNASITNFSCLNSSCTNIYVGNLYSLTGDAYSLSGSNTNSNTSYITYDNNSSSISINSSFIKLETNDLTIGDNVNDSNISSSNVAMNILKSFGLKVNASNVLILDTSGNTTLGNSYNQTNINSSNLLLFGSSLQATTNGYNIISGDNQNNTTIGNSVGTITLNGVTTCNNLIKATSFKATSDKRVKMNIEDLNRVTSLDTIRQLKPKMYDFIDSHKNQLGFIAQEIKTIDLLKSSIHESPGFIPNIYRTVHCYQGWFTIDIPLYQGDKIRYTSNGKMYHSIILNVSNQYYQLEDPITGEIFIYGTEVPDFHSIEKDMIFTLSVSAIQQLDEIVTRQQTTIDEYKVSLDELKRVTEKQQKTINILLEKIDATLVP